MIKYNHLQPFTIHLQSINNQYPIINNSQQLNTTIYNHLQSITTDIQSFTIYLQPIYNHLQSFTTIYNTYTTYLQSIYNHLQSIYNPFTLKSQCHPR